MELALPVLPGLHYSIDDNFIFASDKVEETLHHLASCPDCSRTLDITEAALVVNPFRVKGTRNYEWVKKLMSTFSDEEHFSIRHVDMFLRRLRWVINSTTIFDHDYDEVASVECMTFQQKLKIKKDCECSVCLEELKPTEEIVKVVRCRHVFHDACLKEWFKNKSTCPLCRQHVLKTQYFDWCVHNMNFT